MTRPYDWEDEGEFTAEDIPRLDELHTAIGLGEDWLNSKRRADILSRGVTTEEVVDPDENLKKLYYGLWNHLNREPTVDEIYTFIFGTNKDRASILQIPEENL